MKPNIPENPKNCRISTYLTAEEIVELSKIIGERSVASWLRDLVLAEIYEHKVYTELQNNLKVK